MPKYKLPKLEEEDDKYIEPVRENWPSQWDREIRIPVNKAILAKLEVGKSATITLTGKVEGLTDEERENGRNRTEVLLVVSEVELPYDDNEFSEITRAVEEG